MMNRSDVGGISILAFVLLLCVLYGGIATGLVSCATHLNDDTVLITRAKDGDTVEDEFGRAIRLNGIQAPERGEPGYEEATARLRELVAGKRVRLEFDERKYDRYDRILAYIWLDGELINEVLVREGFATVEIHWPNTRYAERLHEAARQAKNKGIQDESGENISVPWKDSGVFYEYTEGN